MAIREFALEPIGVQRIQVHWTDESESATVLLNRSAIGSLATLEERTAGKYFTLPDGSLLQVLFINGEAQAFRNGAPLAGASPIASDPLPLKRRGGCLTIWLILNLVLMILLLIFYSIATLANALHPGSTLLAWVFPMFAVANCLGIAGITALFFWKKWGFFLVVVSVLIGVGLSLFLGQVNIPTFTPVIGVIVLFVALQRTHAWQHLT